MTYKKAMRARLASLVGNAIPWVAALGLGALGLSTFCARAVPPAEADVMDPTVAKTIAIGTGGARWPSERGSWQRNGRVASLPTIPRRKWKRDVGQLAYAPVVASDGTIVLIVPTTGGAAADSTILELSLADGTAKGSVATRLGDIAASSPIILASGLRVAITTKDAVGVDPGGVVRFRTPLGGSVASAGHAAAIPLPSGGFSVARAGELIELDSSGTIVGRVKLDVTLSLAARDNGDTVAVAINGDLFTWRAGKVPRLVGTFGDKSMMAGIASVCPLGPVVDGNAGSGGPGKRRERVLCSLGNEGLVEQIDLATGKRTAVLAPPAALVRFKTSLAVGAGGDLAIGTSDGTVSGISSSGLSYGPIDIPGTISMLGLGKDAGFVVVASQGEFAPIVADDGAVLFGSTEGVAIAYPNGLVTRIAKCGGASGAALATVAGVASAGPGMIVIACNNGDVELIGEGTAPPPPPPPTNTALVPIPLPSTSASAP